MLDMNKFIDFYNYLESKVISDEEGIIHANWAKNLQPCVSAGVMLGEATWIIFCSGISYKAARSMQRLYLNKGICNHRNKYNAIKKWEENYKEWWQVYCECFSNKEKIEFLSTLPYFRGEALVYQLCKNLGIVDYCKPDVHLKRLALKWKFSNPQILCEKIAFYSGQTVAYVDTILWFAAMKKWAYEDF